MIPKIKLLTLAFTLFFVSNSLNAYDNLLFKPLTANVFEPRVGSVYDIQDDKLRLDIGTSIDLYDFKLSEKNETRLGTDFFTYTRLRSVGKMKFPVETSDYFFGVNASTKGKIGNYVYSSRIRLAHISSHMVDGLAKDTVFTVKPFVYSREFLDINGALNFDFWRPYLGIYYVFSVQPVNANPVIPYFGFDINYNLTSWLQFVAGYDFKLGGYDDKYMGVNSAQFGLLFLTSKNLGVMLSAYRFDGNSIHGMFHTQRDSYTGIGFQVIFY